VKLICYAGERKIVIVLRGVAGFAQIWGVDNFPGGPAKSRFLRCATE
jgi:hypothetical protein